jgi:hypothetical protein
LSFRSLDNARIVLSSFLHLQIHEYVDTSSLTKNTHSIQRDEWRSRCSIFSRCQSFFILQRSNKFYDVVVFFVIIIKILI